MLNSPAKQVTCRKQSAANSPHYASLVDQEEGDLDAPPPPPISSVTSKPLTLWQRISASMHRFYRRNFHWLLYLKILPSMLLLGTFGRRPITIAKLAAPKLVESFAAFLGPLLGPILFLAMIDSLFIAACVFKENWRAREYEKAMQRQSGVDNGEIEEPHTYVEKLRESIRQIVFEQTDTEASRETFIKNNIIDQPFKLQLNKQGIEIDLFVKELLETNHYCKGPYDLTDNNNYSELLTIKNQNYAQHWLGAQIDYYKYLLTLDKNKNCLKENDPEANRVFALNNIFNSTFRNQLSKMGLDENKIVEWVLEEKSTAFILQKTKPGRPSFFNALRGKQPDYRQPFDYAKQWLKAEIKLLQQKAGPKGENSADVSERLSDVISRSPSLMTDEAFKQDVLKTGNNQRYTYSHHNIVNRFQCLSTEKDFEKEHPFIYSFMRVYDNWFKRLLVFPLRTISLALALEVMLPISFPLYIGIIIYASIGLALSSLIITLEHFSDTYLDELKDKRDKELQNLHKSESAGTFSRLQLKGDNHILRTENAQQKQKVSELRRVQSTSNLHLVSPGIPPVSSSPQGDGASPGIPALSLAGDDSLDNVRSNTP